MCWAALFIVVASPRLLHSQEAEVAADRLTLLDGTPVTGRVTAIGSSGAVSVEGLDSTLQLDALRMIQRPSPAQTSQRRSTAGLVQVDLVAGGRILASDLAIADERCEISWKFGESLSLPLEALRAIRFDNQNNPEFQQAVAGEGVEFDRLFAKVDGKLTPIRGFIEQLDGKSLSFEWNNESQSIPRRSLHGIVLALVGDPPQRTGLCRIDLLDGSVIWGRVEGLSAAAAGPQLSLRFFDEMLVTLPWEAVARVKVQSENLVYLSDLKPVEVEEQPIVAFPRTWQRNTSVTGLPLRIGQESFDSGIGVQARSKLTFLVDKKFTFLTATIGIDAETAGRGDCVFIVLADGKPLFQRRVKGSDPPHRLRVRLDQPGVVPPSPDREPGLTEGLPNPGENSGGVSGPIRAGDTPDNPPAAVFQRISLVVEPGEDLDFGDHADWCDACFVIGSK